MTGLRTPITIVNPPRIAGLDIARALAIIGMVAAHMTTAPDLIIGNPETWVGIIHGNTSLLFALLAGVSISLMTKSVRQGRDDITRARLRLIGRGAAIFTIGIFLELFATPIAIILPLFGILYLALLPFLRFTPAQLLAAAAIVFVLGPPLTQLVLQLEPHGTASRLLFMDPYPITSWLALGLIGMLVGQLDLQSAQLNLIMITGGVGLALIGYALAGLAGAEAGREPQESGWVAYTPLSDQKYGEHLQDPGPFDWIGTGVMLSEPHTGGLLELVIGCGVSLAVLGACLLLGRTVLRWALLPLAALGSMPLTVYSVHVIIYVFVYGSINAPDFTGPQDGDTAWLWMLAGLLLASTVWALTVGRGPLESLMRLAGKSAAGEPSTRRQDQVQQ